MKTFFVCTAIGASFGVLILCMIPLEHYGKGCERSYGLVFDRRLNLHLNGVTDSYQTGTVLLTSGFGALIGWNRRTKSLSQLFGLPT
jgi:hypothetical protein